VRNQDRRTGNEETRIQSFARSPGYGRTGRDEMHRRVAQKQGGVLDSAKGDNSFWILRIRAEGRRWIYTTTSEKRHPAGSKGGAAGQAPAPIRRQLSMDVLLYDWL
jgi:hypothetical protein